MHNLAFLQDLAVVMIVAGFVTVVCHRLRQPVVLGYLAAGVLIGPHTPPYPLIEDEGTIRTLADLGIVFLMFSIGLDFNLRKIKGIGPTVFVAGALETLMMFWIGYETGRLLGWSPMDRIFLGAMLSISSTMIVARTLRSLGRLDEAFTQVIFGIMVFEDILGVLVIALLSSIALTGHAEAAPLLGTSLRLAVFLAVAVVLGLLIVPCLLRYVARFKDGETLLVAALGLCFGVSLLAVKLGYSPALGAFIVGAVVASARESGRIKQLTEPLRDMFSAVFFVAMGLLVDPRLLVEYAVPIGILTAAVVIGKILACTLGTFVAGHGLRTAIRVGMSLGQIGEFSFVIAALGSSLGVTAPFLYPIAACVSAVTAFFNLPLARNADRFAALVERSMPGKMRSHMALYSQWAGRLVLAGADNVVAWHIRRAVLQISLNLCLIAAAFAGAAYLVRQDADWFRHVPEALGGPRALLWLATMLAASPLYVATLRKFNALAMLLAEIAVPASQGGAHTGTIRALMSTTILAAGVLGLTIFTMILSAALLPPAKILTALALIVGGAALIFWNAFVKVYAKAQIALREAMAPASPKQKPKRPDRMLPREAELATVTLKPESGAAGKLLRELELRAKTGANIVGITRGETSLVNPGPDEELAPGDVVLILGSAKHLAAARAFFEEKRADPEWPPDSPPSP